MVNIWNVGANDPELFNLRKLYNDGATVIVDVSDQLNLFGIYYKQSGGTTIINQFGTFSIGVNSEYADGGTTFDKNFYVFQGIVKLYTHSTLSTANGDLLFEDSHFDIYSPGYWDGMPGSVTLSAGGDKTSTFTGANSEINFKDYSPPGAINVVNTGAVLNTFGNLKIIGGTVVNVRLLDQIDTNHKNCTLGPATALHISGTPPWESDPYVWEVIICGQGTLTGQFGGVSIPPPGWWWADGGGLLYSPNAVTISWTHEG